MAELKVHSPALAAVAEAVNRAAASLDKAAAEFAAAHAMLRETRDALQASLTRELVDGRGHTAPEQTATP